MDGAGRNEDAVARLRMKAMESVAGGFSFHVLFELGASDARLEAGIDLSRWGSIDNDPRFGLSLFVAENLFRLGIVGMDLHGEKLVTIEKLDEEREFAIGGNGVTEDLSRMALAKFGQGGAGERSFADDRDMMRMAADLP